MTDISPEAVELLPCPFCGDCLQPYEVSGVLGYKRSLWQHPFNECLLRGKQMGHVGDFGEAWNTRAQAQRIVELEAALKVAVSDNEKAAIAISDGLRGSAIKHMANSSVTLNAALEGKKP